MNQKVRLALILAGGFFLLADRIFKFLSVTFFDQPILINRYIGWLPSGNRGIAFGILLPNYLIILLSIIFIIILAWLFKKNMDLFARMGIFSMILGALSNLVDRLYYGHTLDYLLVYISLFNIADILIVFGALACLISISKNSYAQTSKQDL